MTDSTNPQSHTPKVPDAQTVRLANYIQDTALAPLPLPREFFYGSLPLCVIDAVFSIGVTYTSTRNTVNRFCERQGWNMSLDPDMPRMKGEHSVSGFLCLLECLLPEQLAVDLFGNRQRTSSRSGILKAEAVQRFAVALKNAGIDDFCDFDEHRLRMAETLVRKIPGQASGISFDYFRMLAGDDTLIKPDRMVQRYIAKALNEGPQLVRPDKARVLLSGAALLLVQRGQDWSPRKLDYAIWNAESAKP